MWMQTEGGASNNSTVTFAALDYSISLFECSGRGSIRTVQGSTRSDETKVEGYSICHHGLC